MKKAFVCISLFVLPLVATGCGPTVYDGSEKAYNSGMHPEWTDRTPNYIPDGEHDAHGNLLP